MYGRIAKLAGKLLSPTMPESIISAQSQQFARILQDVSYSLNSVSRGVGTDGSFQVLDADRR